MIRAVRDRLRAGPRAGVLALVTGSAAGQGIALISTPVLARLYSPDAFGIFSYLLAVSLVMTAVATLRLETAIPLARTIDDSRALVRIALVVPVCLALPVAAAVASSHRTLSALAGFDVLPWAWWLLPLVILTAWFNVLSEAAIRDRAYSAIAARTFIQSIGVAAGQAASAAVTRSAGGLLTGQVIGRSFGMLALARTARHLLVRPPAGAARRVARRYWRFPVVLTPSALLNTLGTNLPLILVGAWFGPQAAGYLGLTQRVALAPTVLVAVAVGQVFSGELSSQLRRGAFDNRALYLRTSRRLAIGAATVAAGLLALSGRAFPFVLGDEWAPGGAYARAIALSVAAGFVASPVSSILIAYERVVTNVLLDVSRIALVGGAGVAAYVAGFSAVETLWVMSVAQAVTYAMTWIIGLRVSSDLPSRRSPGQRE
ncbi:lipopolysaccharide biosynthesis protein [Aeromicrobium wangtongii]|uniref:lipopolysaccharide biosynthesis protein n=1 Tax=Aeromicrobium wangtongii TaxID=2969247 RepID=UPI002017F4C0|nr:oligosaccharide flippase family protein [Aeromicrobium wangtongii]MCL3817584.1 oligosaccharide flippase family protein [Aeromicrobium wangtongii]